MIDRRAFLEIVAGAALGALARPLSAASATAAPGAAASGAPAARAAHAPPFGVGAGRERLERIGLQLYTVRSLMARDFEGTLEAVAAIGYGEVEFAGYFGRSPDEVRSALERVGLAAPAAHLSLEELRDEPDRTFDAARAAGHRYVIVPWLPAEERRTLEGYRRLADELGRLGERARAAGLRFGYHNHDFELSPLEGRVPLDLLIAGTAPELVAFELDVFWLVKGGGEPIDYLARFPGRFELLHVKDMDGTAEKAMVDPGRGVIDFATLLPAATRAGARHFFVEHDRPASPLETIRTGFEYLKGLG